eukprot:scaffold1832_cov362-Prasinococcus_capsulatus_cf.AAC.11
MECKAVPARHSKGARTQRRTLTTTQSGEVCRYHPAALYGRGLCHERRQVWRAIAWPCQPQARPTNRPPARCVVIFAWRAVNDVCSPAQRRSAGDWGGVLTHATPSRIDHRVRPFTRVAGSAPMRIIAADLHTLAPSGSSRRSRQRAEAVRRGVFRIAGLCAAPTSRLPASAAGGEDGGARARARRGEGAGGWSGGRGRRRQPTAD